MRIKELETFVVGNPPPRFGGRYFLFVKLTTDDGVTGIGEVYAASFSPKVLVAMIEDVFARQVRALGRPGDLLILHSTSGESENLLRAVEAARTLGVSTAAVLARGGGRLREAVDQAVVVETDTTARAQELHMAIGHAVCELVDRAVAGAGEDA